MPITTGRGLNSLRSMLLGKLKTEFELTFSNRHTERFNRPQGQNGQDRAFTSRGDFKNKQYANQGYQQRQNDAEGYGGSKYSGGSKPYHKSGNENRDGPRTDGGFKKFDRNFNNKENNYPNPPAQKRQRFDEGGAAPIKSGFSKQPQKSLVALAPNPEEAKSKSLVMLTNQFRMTIGQNAPQYYMYPMILFHGTKKEGLTQEGYQFTPFDI